MTDDDITGFPDAAADATFFFGNREPLRVPEPSPGRPRASFLFDRDEGMTPLDADAARDITVAPVARAAR